MSKESFKLPPFKTALKKVFNEIRGYSIAMIIIAKQLATIIIVIPVLLAFVNM